jgi:hypothetical protein
MFEAGQIVRFNYFWSHQVDRGEESGRKARPACVVVKTEKSMFLFPITSQRPDPGRASIAISEIECRRGGIKPPSWIVVDEYNRIGAAEAHDFESVEPLGSFSMALLRRIAEDVKALAQARRLRSLGRT